MRELLSRVVSPDWRFRAHRLSRLRWLTKYQLTRDLKPDVGVWRQLAYVLLDPELSSYSFELGNEAEVIAGLAAAIGRQQAELAAYAAETHHDPELNEMLTRHLRWRFDMKRRLPLGNRLAWYVLVRAYKPKLVVETGIYHGLGSLALLRALERNRQEGSPGELMSFDTLPSAGSVVREEARHGWSRFIGSTHDLLLPALENRRVDMLFHDTLHTEENQRFEFEAALTHATDNLLLLDASGGHTGTLEAICAEREGIHHRVWMRSRNHVLRGYNLAFATFTGAPREGTVKR